MDHTLPPRPVETRWMTVTGAAQWVKDRQVLLLQLLRFWASAQSEERGVTASTRQYAQTAIAALQKENVRAAVVVLAEFSQVMFDAEVFFAQGSDDVKPGFHAHLQPRRVLQRSRWLEAAQADLAGHMPESVAGGFGVYAAKLIAASIASMRKQQFVWLRVPLVLDALASDQDASSLATALLQRDPRGKHELLQYIDEADLRLLKEHPLYAQLQSIADGRPSDEASSYLQRHTLARLTQSQSTESSFSVLGHLLANRPRVAKLRVEQTHRHLENSGLPPGRRRTKKTIVTAATTRPTLSTKQLEEARRTLKQRAESLGKNEFNPTQGEQQTYAQSRFKRPTVSTSTTLAELRASKAHPPQFVP